VIGFEQLLVGLVSSYRYEGDEINVKLAQTEANILHESIKEKKTNYEEVTRILTTRSKTQLVATFNRYRDEHGISISKVLINATPIICNSLISTHVERNYVSVYRNYEIILYDLK